MQCNGNIYSYQVPEKLKHMDLRAFLIYKLLGKLFTKNKYFMHFAVPRTIKL